MNQSAFIGAALLGGFALFLAARGRLGAIDLTTEKIIWENTYDGQCCERPQITGWR